MCYTEFVEKRNITLSLPTELLRRAKLYAAVHDTTVNTLVRDLLLQRLEAEDSSRRAAARVLQIAAEGPDSPVDPHSIARESLYERT